MVEKKRVFKYQDLESNALFERANERDDRRDSFLKSGVKYFSPKEKKNRIRILPPTWANAKHYGFDAYIHYGIGRSNSSYLCPIKMNTGDKCPICSEIFSGPSKNDKEFTDKVKARRKVLVYVIDREDEAAGPKLFPMPLSMDRNFVMQSVDDGTGEPLRIHNPDVGYDVSFEKEGIGIKTKYSGEVVARKSTPLSDNPATQDKWLQFITDNPIPEILETKDYEYIKSAFDGKVVEEEEKPEPKKYVRSEPEPAIKEIQQDDALSRVEKEEIISDNYDFRLKEIRGFSDKEIDELLEKLKSGEPEPEAKSDLSGTDKLAEIRKKYGSK
jgi:hypothetical protein